MADELSWEALQKSLPAPPSREELDPAWRAALARLPGRVVVLDDDPTGTQTVHGVPVYTSWDTQTLARLIADESGVAYILTNSRALKPGAAAELHRALARNLRAAAPERDFLLISRSDSTLRGHYPLETRVLAEELYGPGGVDGELLIPFFAEGGRYTVGDVHYVKDGDRLVPTGETEFARDSVFGYRSSDLRAWVAEKTGGAVPAAEVISIPLVLLRTGDADAVAEILCAVKGFGKVAVNAADYADLKVLVIALAKAHQRGKRFLFRTAASFVRVIGGIEPRPLLTGRDLYPSGAIPGAPGLVVVGSHTRKTTTQLARLRELPSLDWFEWSVPAAGNDETLRAESARVVTAVAAALAEGRDACVHTSRDFHPAAADLDFAARVSEGLVRVVRELPAAPGYLVAKGGITSSDLAVKALGVQRAEVLGQIQPGVPVWRLGPETRFPGLPYVVFPGNVGQEETLLAAVRALRGV